MTTKPRMLFVDDSSKRIHSALNKYGKEYEVVIAPNVPEALRLLSAEDWDTVSLDFDLDGNDFGDPNSKTCAMEILRYIGRIEWPLEKIVPEFIVHSSNIFGAVLLYEKLKSMVAGNFFHGSAHVTMERYVYDKGEA